MQSTTPKPILLSYAVFASVLVLAGWLQMATLLITVLFGYFALNKLTYFRKKWLAVVIFLVVICFFFSSFVYFLRETFEALPKIASKSIPEFVQYANNNGINLPFDDKDSLKDVVLNALREAKGVVGNFAKIATKEFVILVVGVVIAIGIFLHREPEDVMQGATTLYSQYYYLILSRFRSFYRCFETVMGAQMIISAINTAATSVFVLAFQLPYAGVVIPLTFFCGLLPIVGNLLSNTLIVGIALTLSPQMAGWALLFLLIVHKLEYFLNSKIIGSRIRHPMWLTLIALFLGESVMGIPGIILAPVFLNFLKVEGSRYPASDHALQEPNGTVP